MSTNIDENQIVARGTMSVSDNIVAVDRAASDAGGGTRSLIWLWCYIFWEKKDQMSSAASGSRGDAPSRRRAR